jgi:hypothetical protein
MAKTMPATAAESPRPGNAAEYHAFLSDAHRDRRVTTAIQKGLHQIGRHFGQLRGLSSRRPVSASRSAARVLMPNFG